ncbi:hypothetical protein SGGMMB4_02016 [Sodalis glossinidius str. 'morsitans']|uniref:Uncharacterized protein n=1 Tax=Sodalis glossinidius (strain morsitans) TaxID=343509 RepID=A0A193QHV7_SODGM|nr:hypothetical protein [Sodalis glossinidius]CRL44751.1 hypothetical protein SGGMMB4_02016 [Sodalis glossinidius str. 'morsitans']
MKDNTLRKSYILQNLPLQLPGLETYPLFRSATDKALHNVCYTDYTSAEESRQKHAHYEHDEIVDIDFIWHLHASCKAACRINNISTGRWHRMCWSMSQIR